MRSRREPAPLHANLTPMIDVTFLLIVFFVLVSQIVEVENVDLSLPQLFEPATDLPGDAQRAVINVVPGQGGRASMYRVGSRSFAAEPAGLAAMTDHVTGLLRANATLRINVRADQQTHYEDVEPVLRAVARAGRRVPGGVAPKVNLVVLREE